MRATDRKSVLQSGTVNSLCTGGHFILTVALEERLGGHQNH